ncbi:TetR/AcrR family transcriptional regulator [Gryllotalpicola protaetiae]|uniref:TetR/AcrR family transcriptional regulator n=1 Tax=Gryllotalpicola protaetiae TaxID=2419771 RepID=A0A387BJH8_9MICO|nr:TetR/AcrR family transcriptional regulator [Gryllotalpicola protaetiae]AYG04255.1 TetR/AcrR family transcriptional regulator [Gryllotalpicola protaetiae]
MDAAGDDPRAARSKRALVAAGTELLDAYDLEELSITQVVAAAGVTRPTFYQHFGDLAELARAAAVTRLDEEFERHEPVPPSVGDWLARVEPVVHELLEHLAAHRDFYRRVLHGPRTGAAVNAAVDLVARRILERSPLQAVADPDSEEIRDSVVILSGGIVWLLSNWLGTPLTGRDSVEAMAHRISVQLTRFALAD